MARKKHIHTTYATTGILVASKTLVAKTLRLGIQNPLNVKNAYEENFVLSSLKTTPPLAMFELKDVIACFTCTLVFKVAVWVLVDSPQIYFTST